MDPSPFSAIIEAFNADDPELRVRALRTCLAEDGEVSHINGQNVGPAGFSNDIGHIREWLPGCTAELRGQVRTVQSWDAQGWVLRTADGAVFATGEYVGRRSADGKYDHLASIPDAHD
jgi:hypothetical protein